MRVQAVVLTILLSLAAASFLPTKDVKAETKPAAAKGKPVVKVDTKPVVAIAKPVAKAEPKPVAAKKPETKPVAAKKPETKPVYLKVEAKPAVAKKVESKPVVATKPVTKPVEAKKAETKLVVAKKPETKPVVAKKAVTKPVVAKKAATKPVVAKTAVTKPVVAVAKAVVVKAAPKDVPKAAVALAVSHAKTPTIHEHAVAAQKSADEAVMHLEKAKAAYAKTKMNVQEAVATGKKIEGTAGDIKTLYTPPKPKVESGARPLAVSSAFLALFLAVVYGNC